MKYKLAAAVHTDVGGRNVNEDSAGVFSRGALTCCVLCDGLGGHGMGDTASQLAVKVFESQLEKDIKPDRFLGETFQAAQDILQAEQAARNAKRKMKTTCTALVSDGKKAYIGHIGDSRLYVFYKNSVRTRTLDHSIPQMLALSGEITDSEIRNHPDRSTILRVMGTEWEKPMYQLMKPIPLRKCQAFLLCSDGFWELIEDDDMCRLLEAAATPEQWLDEMTQLVMKNGQGINMDNNTAVAAWVIKEK